MRFIFGELNQGAVGTLSVVFFSVFFIGLVAWVYRRTGRDSYARAERIPLDD